MIDAWTGRTPSPSEFDRPPGAGPVSGLVDRIDAVATELREKTTNLFRTAGITISNTLMTLANNLRVEGTLTSTGPASFGGNTTVTGALSTTGAATLGGNTNVTGTFSTTGAATFGGNTSITGTLGVTGTANIGGQMNVTGDAVFSGNLAVPNGSITNAALANPVTGVTNNAFQSGISAGPSSMAVASASVTVPDGFTQARVIAISNAAAGNSAVNCYTRINGSDGGTMTGVYAFASSSHAVSLSGLTPGSTITAQTMIAAIPAYPTCMATTTILAFFFK